jgi:hypothetical protein
MIDHVRPAEYVLDRVGFTHSANEYSGRGLLTWDPEKGIHIQAFLDQSVPQGSPFAPVGVVEVEDTTDARRIRMAGRSFGHAIAPNVFPHDLQGCLHEGRLSIRPERVIFFQRFPALAARREVPEAWSGSAVLVTKRDLEFPDNLKTETTLNGQTVECRNRGGLCFEEGDGFSVWGRKTSEDLFTLSWALPKTASSKMDAWRWAEAARRALSILFAQTLWPIRVAVTRGVTEITELRPRRQVHTLNHFHRPLTDFGPPDQWKFNRTTFVHLTRFFASSNPHAEICWAIFLRLAEASRQETWQSRELLAATTLEAALRTLDNHAFKPGDNSWKIKQSVESFRRTYLDASWGKACQKALQVRDRLRHRNAHPDWITHPGGSFSKPEMRQSVDDLTFLSRFYGYMILALARLKSFQPKFPAVRFK